MRYDKLLDDFTDICTGGRTGFRGLLFASPSLPNRFPGARGFALAVYLFGVADRPMIPLRSTRNGRNRVRSPVTVHLRDRHHSIKRTPGERGGGGTIERDSSSSQPSDTSTGFGEWVGWVK